MVNTATALQTQVTVSTPVQGWTFTQGLLFGQASFVVLCLLFVRYVVFQPAEDIDQEEWARRRDERRRKTLLSTNAVPAPTPNQLLSKTGYEMATHAAESSDWLNVLFAQILQGYRNDLLSNGGEEGARQKIERWLNPQNGALSWLDPIQVTALSLGSSYPLLSHARIRPSDGQGHIRAEIDIDYIDSAALSLSTSLLINFPRPRFAVLPVSLGVELASIGGTLSVQIHEPADQLQQLHVCLLPDFHLNLKTTTLLGSRAKLQDIPKLEQLILTRLRSIIQDRLVHPNHLTLTLPRLQTSSSSKPIIADLGERAVEAVREGISKAASDLVNINTGDFDTNANQGYGDASSTLPSPPASPPTLQDQLAPAPAAGPSTPSIRTKRIPMPAGFPGYSASAMDTPTPGGTGDYASSRYRSQPSYQTSQVDSRPIPAGRTSSVAPPSSAADGSSQFRFRGAFASQPQSQSQSQPGSAAGARTPAVSADQQRRLGVLNSRA